jgi:hypothetical protein
VSAESSSTSGTEAAATESTIHGDTAAATDAGLPAAAAVAPTVSATAEVSAEEASAVEIVENAAEAVVSGGADQSQIQTDDAAGDLTLSTGNAASQIAVEAATVQAEVEVEVQQSVVEIPTADAAVTANAETVTVWPSDEPAPVQHEVNVHTNVPDAARTPQARDTNAGDNRYNNRRPYYYPPSVIPAPPAGMSNPPQGYNQPQPRNTQPRQQGAGWQW